MTKFRDFLVDSPSSLGALSRRRRWQLFMQYFPDAERMTVIDLGGRANTWIRGPVQPKHVLVLNLGEFAQHTPPWITQRRADACDPPSELLGRHFDLAFSNSLIEHVGGHARRVQLAASVHRLAVRHWVQTPYRYFPVEPHWLFPGFQFLPIAARAWIAWRWRLVHTRPPNHEAALHSVMNVELVSKTEMAAYFPEAEIVHERIGPLTKSLIAVKTVGGGC